MAKNNSIVSFNRKFYKKCNNGSEICPLTQQLEGKEYRKIGFVSQLFYSCIALFILGNNIQEGRDFFSSLLLFSAPLFLEYLPYKSDRKINNVIYIIQKSLFGLGAFIGTIGSVSNIFTIKIINSIRFVLVSDDFFILSGNKFYIGFILYPLFIGILLIFTDIFSLSSLIEDEVAMKNKIAS